MLTLDAKRTALVLIDVQKGTLGFNLSPYTPAGIVATSAKLAQASRKAGALLVYVRVVFATDYADRPQGLTDTPMILPPGGMPADWSDYAPEVAAIAPDLWIAKRQWSAFHGTELDLQLRRRGITHTIFGGIATNFGVESSARDAWQNNYTVVVAEDACSSVGPDLHKFAIEKTLPRVSLVRSSAEIVAALAGAA
ncbi:hydrolase [Dongia sedimenti]|uniref:Hydrolase n=1 Tax=Dongia sedimenti TaxID=3064282 RepID=A0ABU0YG63_9PROT|nr:hydrolase [Rhodospirillaceae bacterium R-7]